ncbi:MAG TPA: M20 family metallopeptidase [Pyrinomonadaceae bacterium]
MVEDIRSIVNIESPSYNVEQSRKVVDQIVKLAGGVSTEVEIERISADGCGEHLVIRAFPSGDKVTLLLGHTDTVHPIGTAAKNPTRIEGDRLYGCGVFDMKANIVLMLEALRFFADTGTTPSRPITIFLSCDEEVGSHSGRALIEREAANAQCCLVFEPSFNGRVKTGRKGTGMFKLRAHGRPAHAGLEPEKGINAITELSRQVEQIHAVARPEIGTTVNVTTFHGGTTTNVIPECAECDIDVRFSTMDEAQRVDSQLRSLKPIDERVNFELLGDINRPPLERTAAVAALYEKARDLGGTFGYEIGESQVGGGSDGNFVAALGVPVLDGVGIRGDGAHTLHEHILISDIAKRATLVTMLSG